MGLATADAQQLEKDFLASLVDDKWREFIKRAMPFHAYSFGNICLILAQRSDVTRVAGYRDWQRRNRYVKKGSKAIWIWAPMLINDPAEEGGKILRFRTVPVFAYEDTEGDNSSDFEAIELSCEHNTESYQAFLELRVRLMSEGCDVTLADDLGNAAGSYRRSTKEIKILSSLTIVQQFSVMLHEAAHHLQHELQERDDSYDANELSAEMAACKALARFGIDGTDSSFGYVYGWANGEPDLLRRELLRADKLAKVLIDWCTPAIELEEAA